MGIKDERLFAAMESYLTGEVLDVEFKDQILSDLDLVRRCYDVTVKQRGECAKLDEIAKQVTFDVFSGYAANVRSKMAEFLHRDS